MLVDIQNTFEAVLEYDRENRDEESHLEVLNFENQLEDRLYQISKESHLFFLRLSNKN